MDCDILELLLRASLPKRVSLVVDFLCEGMRSEWMSERGEKKGEVHGLMERCKGEGDVRG